MAAINKLGKVAVGGFVACVGSYYLFQNALSKTLINSKFCKDAIELVKNNNGAKLFLGEPIEPVKAKFSDFGKKSKHVEIFVKGSKSTGKVFLTVDEVGENQFEIDSVQLQLETDHSKRLEIKSSAASSS